jgi:hypothetical protein
MRNVLLRGMGKPVFDLKAREVARSWLIAKVSATHVEGSTRWS